MDYKEKYEKALAKAKEQYNYPAMASSMGILEEMFPELKESEDERIRKVLVDYFNQYKEQEECGIKTFYGIPTDDIIAWLERQGKNNMGISEATKQKLEDNLNKALEKETKESWNEFLDEQGEQKPADETPYPETLEKAIDLYYYSYGNGEGEFEHLSLEKFRDIVHTFVSDYGQKPVWSEEDETSIISDLLDYFDEDKCLKHEVNDIVKWLKTIKPQQKGWGENEIKMLDNLITYLDGRKDLLEEIKRTYIDWLKSIKGRVLPQPKQEWSEEDEKMIQDIINDIAIAQGQVYCKSRCEDEINWLKSLKPQSQWKPSEGQLECLGYAIEKAEKDWSPLTNNRIYLTLKALKEQLERL